MKGNGLIFSALLLFLATACGGSTTPSSKGDGSVNKEPPSDEGLQETSPDASAGIGLICAKISKCLGNSYPIQLLCPLIHSVGTNPDLLKDLDDTEIKAKVALASLLIEYKDDCPGLKRAIQLTTQEEESCNSGKRKQYCEEDLLIDCKRGIKEDCSLAGLTCVEDTTRGAECSEGRCTDDFVQCVDEKTVEICEKGVKSHVYCPTSLDIVVHKDGGKEKLYVLGGGICNENAIEVKEACIGDGETCDPETYKPHCEGKVLYTCRGGKVSKVDCGAMGMTCVPVGMLGMPGCGFGSECALGMASCKDDVIKVCSMGMWVEVDCKLVGAHCKKDKGGLLETWYCSSEE